MANYASEQYSLKDIQINNVQYSTFENNKSNLEASNDNSFNQINTISSDDELTLLIDKIINNYGYKCQTIKVFLCTIFMFILCGHFLNNSSNFYWVIKTQFNLSSNFMIFLQSFSFCFKCLGSFFCGFIIKKNFICRKSLIFVCVTIMLLLNILILIHFSLPTYFIFLAGGAFAAGNMELMGLNILCESLPIFLRGSFLCLSFIGYTLSDSVYNFIIRSFSDGNDVNLRMIYSISTLKIILVLLKFIFLPLNDSARNLLQKGEYEKAFEILNKLKTISLSEEEKLTLIKESKIGENSNNDLNCNNKTLNEYYEINNSEKKENVKYWQSFKLIFSDYFLKTTILIIFIRFIYTLLINGNYSIQGLYLQKIIENSDIKKITSTQMIISNFTLISFVISSLLIELKYLGRKLSLILLGFINCLILFIFYFNFKIFYLFASFLTILNSKIFILLSFLSETYPTKLRDLSIGFFNLIDILAGFSGIIVYMSVIQYGIMYPFYISFGLILVGLIFFFLIPNETKNKALDFILNENDLRNYIEAKETKENNEKGAFPRVIYTFN